MDNQLEVSKKINDIVQVLGMSEASLGFEKAYKLSSAIVQIKALLSNDYMIPIMELQNTRIGFKTDKNEGYSVGVVKNCLIEAVIFGLQPYGNMFNIIANNMYATKEGLGYLLSNFFGLSYSIIPDLPRVSEKSAAIIMNVEWSIKGVSNSKKIDIPIKVNQYMGTDAIIGKATRKARKWLYDTITGSEIPDGDTSDTFPDLKSVKTIEITLGSLKELYEQKKELLSDDKKSFAKRIIDNDERASFVKLNNLLKSY